MLFPLPQPDAADDFIAPLERLILLKKGVVIVEDTGRHILEAHIHDMGMVAADIALTCTAEKADLAQHLAISLFIAEAAVVILHVPGRDDDIACYFNKFPIISALGTNDPAKRNSRRDPNHFHFSPLPFYSVFAGINSE
jgi:hypothetical protein